jgi:hypothetical protein
MGEGLKMVQIKQANGHYAHVAIEIVGEEPHRWRAREERDRLGFAIIEKIFNAIIEKIFNYYYYYSAHEPCSNVITHTAVHMSSASA